MHREFDLAAAVCSRSSNGATRGDIPFVFRSECEIDSPRSFRIRFVIGLFFFLHVVDIPDGILIFASMHVIQLYVYDINFARKIRGSFIIYCSKN